jgi:heavy metal sensor kinase
MRWSLRARVTVASAAALALILGATGVFLYVRLEADLISSVDESLSAWAEGLLPTLDGATQAVEVRTQDTPTGSDQAALQVLDPNAVEARPGHPSLLSPAEVAGVRGPTFLERDLVVWGETEPSRLLAQPAGDGLVLVVAVPIDDQKDALTGLARLLSLAAPIALGLTVGLTWVLVGLTLRPVERMRREAAAISGSDPGRRLPVPDTVDEVARLGETLNAMLERLEEANERERRLVDDASHELRTPLANLKAELDLARARARTPEELEAALRSASEETDRLARLADDLLVLARANGGRLPVRRRPVDVAALIAATTETFAASAASRGVAIVTEVEGTLRADLDELRLRQAIGNLLENALRSTPPGGTVTVAAARDDGTLRIEVRDTGEGFPPGSLPGAFEAFARAEAARGGERGGAGLGLAIVRAVAEAHGGRVEASNAPGGGAIVVMDLTLVEPATRSAGVS